MPKETVTTPEAVKKLWLWQNGDHFVAYDNLYPCYPDGDPRTLGEPIGYALLKESTPAQKWQCNHCGHVEHNEKEVLCWKCGKGEMIYGTCT